MKNKWLYNAAAVAAALLAWQAAAVIIDQSIIIASPLDVGTRLFTIWREEGFVSSLWFTFSRIVLGFFLALAAGVLLAVLAGRLRIFEILLRPYMTTVKTVPVASFIIIALVWLSSARLSVFISFLMVLPVVYSNLLSGIQAADKKMAELARVYKIPWHRRLLYINLPRIKPFLISACSVSLGLSWKAGVAAEVIGIPTGSIGEQLYFAKVYLNTVDLFAWTIIIVLISYAFEKLFMGLLRLCFKRLERG